jgi:hypothetical protein
MAATRLASQMIILLCREGETIEHLLSTVLALS